MTAKMAMELSVQGAKKGRLLKKWIDGVKQLLTRIARRMEKPERMEKADPCS